MEEISLMKQKKAFYTEIAYVFGILTLALGTAMMERADFGMSMVVAPAYLFYLKLSQYFSFLTFGMMEYILQAVLILLLSITLRKFKISYLFSFVTAVLYGLTLDLALTAVNAIPFDGMIARTVFYLLGMVTSSVGVAFYFHTYISPAAYELIVSEISKSFKLNTTKVKTVYDCASCLISIILSFSFFGFMHFEGIKLGTVFCALINGWLIGRISKLMEKHLDFKDALKRRNGDSL